MFDLQPPRHISTLHKALNAAVLNVRSCSEDSGHADTSGAVDRRFCRVRAEEFHLRALPDTYVNLSIHTAPDVRPLP